MTEYVGFSPLHLDGYTIGIERLAQIHREIRPLHAAHYAETETLYLDTPFNPDYPRYIEQEKAAQFVLFTVRYGVELIGYLQYYVFRDMHTQGVYQAREDALFVDVKHRGKKLAPKILAYAEQALAELGCTYIGMSSKGPAGGPDIGEFLERSGYRPVATFYAKKLEK